MAIPEIAVAEHELPEAVGVDVAEPAGSARKPAGSAGPSALSGVAAPAPVPPVPGTPRLRLHSSPRQILEQRSPNSTFTIGINHSDHRFYVKCKVKAANDDRLISPYQNQSFSKTLYLTRLEAGKNLLLKPMIIAGANGNLSSLTILRTKRRKRLEGCLIMSLTRSDLT